MDAKQHWVNTFNKNLERNRQLQFYRNFFLSSIDQGEPVIDMIVLREILDNESCEKCLVFALDKRETIYKCVAENPNVSACIYFPLTKEKYIFKGKAKCLDDYKNELLGQVWNNSLSQEERNGFTRSHPNDVKSRGGEIYGAQDISTISPNFTVLTILPNTVEHSLFKMPEVIADARNPVFESEFKPYKKEKKFLFQKKGIEWTLNELNP